MVVLEGTGHYPMIENPYEFNEAVRTFLIGNGYT
ncbi:alpha/beta hydrolase [Actinomadura madurae]|nr:alpha/beta hydrolase [Actinomadura madurae]URM96968.1 alpha/beta hydrolase [Actinomadura madurae]